MLYSVNGGYLFETMRMLKIGTLLTICTDYNKVMQHEMGCLFQIVSN